MSESVVMGLTVAVAVVMFVVVWKLLQAVIKALLVAGIVAALFYWGLPRLEDRGGDLGLTGGRVDVNQAEGIDGGHGALLVGSVTKLDGT